jgi:DNA-directed RNA polymerase subunit RPC12/RpoP
MTPDDPDQRPQVYEACPHCGRALSSWEKVLLSVDRALMCKNCWYRIILDVRETRTSTEKRTKSHPKERNL